MHTEHIKYMYRCIQLAQLGSRAVRPNPLVGAVLVCNNKIIGEGYHEQYGQPHAEINCMTNVTNEHQSLIKKSTLYVSLEPCFHVGKTPPCVQAILNAGIKKVVIGHLDINPKTNGKSVRLLESKGVKVVTGILEKECAELNKIFFTLQEKKRPYIQLKWAESANGFIAEINKQTKLSNSTSDILVHQMRSEADGLLIGYNTAKIDKPRLNTRLVKGLSPTPIIIDWEASLDYKLVATHLDAKTIIINQIKNETTENIQYIKCDKNVDDLLSILYDATIYSILIEGGAKTLHWFLEHNAWDEALVIRTPKNIENGTQAPNIPKEAAYKKNVGTDEHLFYTNYVFNACTF